VGATLFTIFTILIPNPNFIGFTEEATMVNAYASGIIFGILTFIFWIVAVVQFIDRKK